MMNITLQDRDEFAELAPRSFETEHDIAFQNAIATWARVPVPELSVILAQLRMLSMMHQTHHWQSHGDPFYGDHQLFERLYSATLPEIDSLAERAVGLGSPENVDLQCQLGQIIRDLSAAESGSTIPTEADLLWRSLRAEIMFVESIRLAVDSMREVGSLTVGTENMLAGIADVHEGHVYLLRQRVSSGVT